MPLRHDQFQLFYSTTEKKHYPPVTYLHMQPANFTIRYYVTPEANQIIANNQRV